MICVKIMGGLGNQMFQYAVARNLAIKNSCNLYLDISYFKKNNQHTGFKLFDYFNIKAKIASNNDLNNLLGFFRHETIRRFLKKTKVWDCTSNNLYFEPQHNYWPGINNIKSMAYLDGYWQSEKYFLENSSVIRNDFAFNSNMLICDQNLLSYIRNTNSIALHIRRGDYVSDKVMFLNGLSYYHDAVSLATEKFSNAVFFVFSDDIDWARKNLVGNFIFVENHGQHSAINDMYMMSICNHNIISNSTFSWWAAWLNSNKAKTIIAPRNWFKTSLSDADLMPKSWLRI